MSASSNRYFADFFQSPGNMTLLLGGTALAVILSFPFGLLGAAFPLLATAALEVLACLFVPDMPSFRAWANQRRAREQSAMTSERMLTEIQTRCRDMPMLREIHQAFSLLQQQVAALVSHSSARPALLQDSDLQRLQSVPAQYLNLRLSLLVIDERAASVDLRKIQRKLDELKAQISNPDPGADVRQLSRARDEYQSLLVRHQRMMSRRTAIEAAMLTLPDQLAEIYQLIMSDVAQSEGARLTDAINSLQLRQEIEEEIADELDFGISSPAVRATQSAKVKQG
jgi:hypothetical protein